MNVQTQTHTQDHDLDQLMTEALHIAEAQMIDAAPEHIDVGGMRRQIMRLHRPGWLRAADDLATAAMLHTRVCRIIWLESRIDEVGYASPRLVRLECRLAARLARRARDRELRRAAHAYAQVPYRERTRDTVALSILNIAIHLVCRTNRALNPVSPQEVGQGNA